ncbi:MAG TPA: diaminopimelate decarboxylase [Ktedonobacterales bacterium]
MTDARDAVSHGTTPSHAHLWPNTAAVDAMGRLTIAGCDLTELAQQFGTPLYVYDEATIRAQCRAFQTAFAERYPHSAVAYAGKAYLSPALCHILREENMELDAVSAGEIAVARMAGFPGRQIHLHGNYKPEAELAAALDAGVGCVVVDSLYEIERLSALAAARGVRQRVWLRVCPDVPVDTHPHDQTGHADSKFGLDVASGAVEAAARAVAESAHLELVGLHAHAGSQVLDAAPIAAVTALLCELAGHLKEHDGIEIAEVSPGGGWGVAYVPGEESPPIERYAEAIVGTLRAQSMRHNLGSLRLVVEPGRAIVARAGVTLYTAGPRKAVRGGRTFLAVDGGMGDNIRPALYGARYHAAVAARMMAPPEETVCVVGRYCESGDVLVQAVDLPRVAPGDVIAVPMSGAYQLPMASNYNLVPRPAVVFVRDGRARLVRRRERLEDLVRFEDGWEADA